MHIGFRKDFSKKRRVLVEGAWGGVRDKCKVGSLNYFCILATYLFYFSLPHLTSSSAARSTDK